MHNMHLRKSKVYNVSRLNVEKTCIVYTTKLDDMHTFNDNLENLSMTNFLNNIFVESSPKFFKISYPSTSIRYQRRKYKQMANILKIVKQKYLSISQLNTKAKISKHHRKNYKVGTEFVSKVCKDLDLDINEKININSKTNSISEIVETPVTLFSNNNTKHNPFNKIPCEKSKKLLNICITPSTDCMEKISKNVLSDDSNKSLETIINDNFEYQRSKMLTSFECQRSKMLTSKNSQYLHAFKQFLKDSNGGDEVNRNTQFNKKTRHQPTINRVIEISNLYSNDVDIYCINKGGYLVKYYKTNKNNVENILNDLSETVYPYRHEVCCWYKRNEFITFLGDKFIDSATQRFMRKPHGCVPENCSCCCKKDKSISVRKSKSTPIITRCHPFPSGDFIINSKKTILNSTLNVEFCNRAEKKRHALPSVDNIIDLENDFSNSTLNITTRDSLPSDKIVIDLENQISNTKFNTTSCHSFSSRDNIIDLESEISNSIFNVTRNISPLNSEIDVLNNKDPKNNDCSKLLKINLNEFLKQNPDKILKTSEVPGNDSSSVKQSISTILDAFGNVRLTINKAGKVAALLNTSVNTLCTSDLKVLASIIAYAQEQVDTLGVFSVTQTPATSFSTTKSVQTSNFQGDLADTAADFNSEAEDSLKFNNTKQTRNHFLVNRASQNNGLTITSTNNIVKELPSELGPKPFTNLVRNKRNFQESFLSYYGYSHNAPAIDNVLSLPSANNTKNRYTQKKPNVINCKTPEEKTSNYNYLVHNYWQKNKMNAYGRKRIMLTGLPTSPQKVKYIHIQPVPNIMDTTLQNLGATNPNRNITVIKKITSQAPSKTSSSVGSQYLSIQSNIPNKLNYDDSTINNSPLINQQINQEKRSGSILSALLSGPNQHNKFIFQESTITPSPAVVSFESKITTASVTDNSTKIPQMTIVREPDPKDIFKCETKTLATDFEDDDEKEDEEWILGF